MVDYNDNEDDGEHEAESARSEKRRTDPRIATLFDKNQEETDLDAIKQTKDLHTRISDIFNSNMKIRAKLHKFIEVLDEWPTFANRAGLSRGLRIHHQRSGVPTRALFTRPFGVVLKILSS